MTFEAADGGSSLNARASLQGGEQAFRGDLPGRFNGRLKKVTSVKKTPDRNYNTLALSTLPVISHTLDWRDEQCVLLPADA